MLNSIIKFSIENKLIIILMVIALMGYGAYQTTQLPIDAVPDITDNQVQIITSAPSLGATDIERFITFPIEQANSNIPGIKEIRSFSRFGLSLVTIVFEDGVDVYWARQQVTERLQIVQSQIPNGMGTPELGPVSSGLGEIFQYVVRPKKGFEHRYGATELRTIQDWIVRRQLLGVKGVAEVSSFGGKLKQYEISINPDRLHEVGITITDVFESLEKNNKNTGGAYIEKGPTVLYIRTEGLMKSKEDIENTPILTKGNNTIFIRDVATLAEGHAIRYGAMCYNDEGEVAGAVVMMLKGANSSEVIKNVKLRVAQIQKTLPEGVVIEPFLDRTKMVNNAISTVQKNLMEGALIVLFVLIIFLGNWRAGFIVASVIPLAMLFAICMMNAFGVSGNLMSLGALDFGLIVDGAVIIVEAVMHQLSHHKSFKKLTSISQHQMDETVTHSSKKMMNSAVFGQLIILIVYLPIFSLQGVEGKMFTPMAQTVVFALIGAFILSLTYIPMMSALFLSKKISTQPTLSDRWMNKLEKGYAQFLLKILSYSKSMVLGVIALFIASIYLMSSLGGEFIPALEEGDFAVDTRVLTGSNINTTVEFTQKAAKILKNKFPEVEKIVTKIGSGEVPTDPMPMEASDMMVILKDKKEWTSAKSFDELSEKMGAVLKDIPGITAGFQYPVQMRFNELMTGARQDVVCKIFGENLDTLSKYATDMGIIVNTVEGAINTYVEPINGLPQMVIQYNRLAIAQYKISIEEVNKVINMALAGQSAGLVFEDEKRFDLVVRLENSKRQNIQDIKNILISTPLGSQIPLSTIADVMIKDGINQIQREDSKRRIIVGFNVQGRDVQSIVQELQNKIEGQVKLPYGYFVTYGGEFENLQNAKKRLMIAVPISLGMILVLLFFAFHSLKHSLLIFSAIPLSMIGGIWALYLRDMPFSISAGIGFIALFGVAVLNGIVLIAEFNRLKKDGWSNLTRIVKHGASIRLRPVLMTASVASLGFLPMALSNGAGAEVQRPLATVVIGGLLSATLLTLFVLPLLYILFEKTKSMKLLLNRKKLSLFFILFLSVAGMSQQAITLQQSLAMAIKNNLSMQKNQKFGAYKNAMVNTYKEIPSTYISTELGQVNSALFDGKFSISQSFLHPKTHKSRKNLLSEEWKLAMKGGLIDENDVKQNVALLYVDFQYMLSKKQLVTQADSLLKIFMLKAKLRYGAGESNRLEKSYALIQQQSNQAVLQEVDTLLKNMLLDFNYLIQGAENYTPLRNQNSTLLELDTIEIEHHPLIEWSDQKCIVAKALTSQEKNLLLPQFNIGYSNNSFQGFGQNNEKYNFLNRFHSVQAGLSIPLFRQSIKKKIEASLLYEKIEEIEKVNYQSKLNTKSKKLLGDYHLYQSKIKSFLVIQLPEAKSLMDAAQDQLDKGDINYLDYSLILRQALEVYHDYETTINALNRTIIQLNYLTLNP